MREQMYRSNFFVWIWLVLFSIHFLSTLEPKIHEKVVPTALPKNTHHFHDKLMMCLLCVKRPTESKHCKNQYKTMIFTSPSHAPRLTKSIEIRSRNHPKILWNWWGFSFFPSFVKTKSRTRFFLIFHRFGKSLGLHFGVFGLSFWRLLVRL